jgi:hypothetical protein
MNEKLLQIPGEITGVKTKISGSWVFSFESQENVPPDLLAQIASYRGKYGNMVFLPGREVSFDDIKDLPQLEKDDSTTKSHSQRLRAVLFVFWKARGGNGSFETFYASQMEKLIESVKDKID